MSKEKDKSLRGPWKNVQAAIWLIGLAILAFNDWWWPGILLLVAISMLSQALIQAMIPDKTQSIRSFEEPQPETEESIMATASQNSTMPAYSTHRLPSECLKCGAPIRGTEAIWTGPQSADCPYCGANLPLHKV